MFLFPARRTMLSVLCLLTLTALTAASCAYQPPAQTPAYSSTMFQQMDPAKPRDQARRESLAAAEGMARNQIRDQVHQLRLSDGRTLGDLAAIDPFVRASVQDNLRIAHVEDRTISDKGLVSVTVRMDLAPLYKMIEDYPNHSIR